MPICSAIDDLVHQLKASIWKFLEKVYGFFFLQEKNWTKYQHFVAKTAHKFLLLEVSKSFRSVHFYTCSDNEKSRFGNLLHNIAMSSANILLFAQKPITDIRI